MPVWVVQICEASPGCAGIIGRACWPVIFNAASGKRAPGGQRIDAQVKPPRQAQSAPWASLRNCAMRRSDTVLRRWSATAVVRASCHGRA